MSLEKLRALMRTYTPGRRVRIKDEAAAARRDKVPDGVTEGLILKVIPLPSTSASDIPGFDSFGVEVEIETSPGLFDSLIVSTDDVEFGPLSLDQLRRDLWRRIVNFPRSSGIGIDFPPGAADDGVIDDVRFRSDALGRPTDLVASVRVPVDPDKNPEGIDVFCTDADFIQCVLRARKSSD
ncbi:MAG: hypothetical protein AAB554_04275 [Patescibacteria group bacterium]